MKRLAPLLACLLIGACVTWQPSPVPASSRQAQQAQVDSAALEAAVQQVQSKKIDYRLSGGDLLKVTVLGEDDMDREIRVSQNGTITYPLVGEVKVGGLTTAGAEAVLAKGLADYLQGPQVTVFIKEYGKKKVYVFGQVMKPGGIELPAETKLTVLEAISQSEGFTRIAAADSTRVVRMVDGKSRTYVIEVSAITKRGEKDKDMVLEPNDIVFVPESMF